MKKILLLILMLAGLQGFAQISLNIKPSHTDFMQYDAVRLRIYLKNYSSMPITFGHSKQLRGELDFVIYHKNRKLLERLPGKKPILSGLILKPGETRNITINLSNYYPLQELGDYSVTAIVKHPRLSGSYRSNETNFSVGNGSLYWKRLFGVPDYTGKRLVTQKVPTRNYNIRIFNNGTAQLYYLIIEDAENVYAVKRLGFDLGPDYRPQLLVDSTARLHAMIHVTQKVFIYYRYNFNGKLEKRQVYLRTTTTPFLVSNPSDGSVIIDGGRIATKDVDYEEIKDLPFMDRIEDKKEDPDSFGDFDDFIGDKKD